MTEPPPRKRFQIHLSTAIVMMFVAGGIIWANLKDPGQIYEITGFMYHGFGWPLAGVFAMDLETHYEGVWHIVEYSYSSIAFDLVIAVTTIFAVWFLCEWLIRHRAAQKGA